MNIAYASDDNFVDVMLVSIMSFNDHNSDATIYVMDCGITEHNKQKILELCSGKNTVLFVDAKEKLSKLNYGLNLDRGSVAAYARLFIGSAIPNEVNRILYLDCDTLIRGPLYKVFDMELNGNIMAGVRDAFSLQNKKVFGLKKGELFVNSGVLLIDLKAYREKRIEEAIFEVIKKDKKIFQGDQGIINLVMKGKIEELPLEYNVLTYLYDFTYEEMMLYRKPDNYFAKEVINQVVQNPIIVHFSTCFFSERPWNAKEQLKHPYYNEWEKYYSLAEGTRKTSNKRPFKLKNMFTLFFIGILHAYVRPLKFSICN